MLGLAAAAGAGSLAAPAAALPAREVEVAVIGGGAAGIAAARTLVRAGVSCVLLEAKGRTGGRCVTDTLTFAAPFDRGAHWLHSGDANPLAKLGRDLGFEIYDDSAEARLMIGERPAPGPELAAYEAAVRSAEDAIIRSAESRPDDGPAAAGLPRDLGDWRGPVRFRLGPLDCGKSLQEISVIDFSRAQGGQDRFCRPGFGTLIATLGRGLPTALATPVSAVVVENGQVRVTTERGELRARAAIVTASTAVLAAGAIAFTPELDEQHEHAFEGLKLGSYVHVGVELPGNPLDLPADTAIYLKTREERTFAALARAGGSEVWYLDTGAIYARELEAAGRDTAVAVATDWLASVFGADIRRRVGAATATAWGLDRHVMGAWSVASPGKAAARATLRQPHAERVFFAGEAAHDTLWGTVAGAWESGEHAAREAMRLVRR